MGLFSKKKTTTKNVATTNVVDKSTTGTLPSWATDLTQNLAGQIGDVGKLNPSDLVAGTNPLIDQAASGAAGLGGYGGLAPADQRRQASGYGDGTAYPAGGKTPGGFAGTSPAGAASGGGGAYDPFGEAAGRLRDVGDAGANTYDPSTGRSKSTSAASVLDDLAAHMSPYTKDVVDTALADFDYGAGQTRAQQDLDLAGAGAFGGSGAALTRSMTEGELTRGRASTSANLRDQAFQVGAGLSEADAGRRQQTSIRNADAVNRFSELNMAARNDAGRFNAGQQDAALGREADVAMGIGDLAKAYGAEGRANLGSQMDLGQALREIDQQKRVAPLTLLDFQGGQLNNLPLNLLAGEHTIGSESGTEVGKEVEKKDPSTIEKVGKAAQIAGQIAALFSDERLKTDIELIGTRPDGLGVYLYRYIWGPARFIGVMAQEVLRVKPEAVVVHPSGYLMVNYGAL